MTTRGAAAAATEGAGRGAGRAAPAARLAGYSAAEAAHMFEEFLEMRLSHDAFWEWLMSYPPHGPDGSADAAVEDEIDRAILALLAFQHGTRPWAHVNHELMDARARLTGLARL